MRTDNLIDLIAADAPGYSPLARRLRAGLGLGALAAVLLLLATIGIRPDLAAALGTARVLFKIGFTLVFAAVAIEIVFRVGLPGEKPRVWLLAIPALLLAVGAISELYAVPVDTWSTRLVGNHAAFCLVFIPLLALTPLALLIWALRDGAPAGPGGAGAAAGLAAGSLAAAIYAWHCPDDSPLFVATWYLIAVAIVSATGFFAGRRLLRW